MSDDRSVLLLLWLADVAVRWGVLIGLLAIAFAIRPPRSAATRHALCAVVLAAGPALALTPRWGEAVIPRPWASPSATFPDPEPIRSAAPAFAPLVESERSQPAILPSPRIDPTPTPAATPQPFDRARFLARALVGVWLAGTLAMLARLALGASTLARWKQSATDPTSDDLAMLTACVADAPGRRGVRMARHAAVASPVVIGGLRPTILVPVDWDAWPPAQRRAGLRHELAHVRRGDDASKLAEELIRCPFWFHPLVAWLLGRIDRERELLCDEAAVALGDDPKGLARLLLELSRRPGPPRRVPSASLPFFPGRRATAVRIERLLEDDMSRTLSHPSFARTWILGPLALAAALGLGGLRVRTATAQDEPRPKPAAPVAEQPSAPSAQPDVYAGRVVDVEGRPIAGATVTPWPVREGEERRPGTTTDADGRFTLNKPAEPPRNAFFSIWKEGYLPTMAPNPSDDRPTTLDRAMPFAAVLVDDRGAPIAGAKVRITRLTTHIPQRPGRNINLLGFSEERPGQDPPFPAPVATTAEDGSFSLPYSAAEKTTVARLKIESAGGRLFVTAPERTGMEPGEAPEVGHVVVSPRAKATIRAVPAARIDGRIVSRVPGVVVEGIGILAVSVPSSSGAMPTTLVRPVKSARADREGRFVIDGLDPAAFTLNVRGPARDRGGAFGKPTTIEMKPGETTEAIVELIPGVEVEGYVFARQTGRPAPGVWVVATQPATVEPGEDVQTETDTSGVFRFKFPPGELRLSFADSDAGYITPLSGSFRSLTIPEGVARFELPPFQVEATVPARVLVLDADRKPVPGAKVALRRNPREGQLDSSGVTDEAGVLQRDRRNGSVILGERARIHVTPPGGELRKFDVAPAADGLIEIVLPDFRLVRQDDPKALRGLVVDPDGKPLAGAAVTIEDASPDVVAEPRRWSLATDAGGRFVWTPPQGLGPVRLSAVMPGLAPRTIPLDPAWVASIPELRIALGRIGTFGGVLVDDRGQPLAGARVQATLKWSRMPGEGGMPAGGDGPYADVKFSISTGVDPASELGFPKEAVTAADGSFTLLGDIPSAIYNTKLEVHAADGTRLSVQPSPAAASNPAFQSDLHTLAPGERPRLAAVPSARIEGRVVSETPGLDLADLTARIPRGLAETATTAPVDREGRFTFEGLDETPVDVVLDGPGVHAGWTFSPARVESPAPGATIPVALRAVPGVEVRGRVVARGPGGPAEGVEVEVWSPALPSMLPVRATTDADGRYAFRLPPGETIVIVSHPAERFVALAADPKESLTRQAGAFIQLAPTASAAKFRIPESAASFDVPPIEVASAVTLHGRLVTKDGKPVGGANLFVNSDRPYRTWPPSPGANTAQSDDRGAFRFLPGAGTVEVGRVAHLGIIRPGAKPQTVQVTPDADGFVEVVVPDEAAASPEAMKGVLNGVILGPAAAPDGR